MKAHITVTGFVQGVGYRKFVRYHARKFNLVGWVRNNPDGSVEAVVVGEKELLEKLTQILKKGPYLAQVDNIHIEWEENPEEFEEFVILK
jgi:acylphosphatase